MRRFLLLALTLSCAHTTIGLPDFARFVEDYWTAQNVWRPSEATALGFHDYDTQLEDLSRARIDTRIAELHRFLARLAAMDRGSMSFDDQIDAEVIDGDIRGS